MKTRYLVIGGLFLIASAGGVILDGGTFADARPYIANASMMMWMAVASAT